MKKKVEKEKVEGYLGCVQHFVKLFAAFVIASAFIKCLLARDFALLLRVVVATLFFLFAIRLICNLIRRRLYAKED